jgi:hypothetical protein
MSSSSDLVQFLTTEHYVLQSARATTVNDATGRATVFLGTVSAGLIALAFLGQASHLGRPFYAFALVLFPSLAFLGFVTLARALQSSIEDTIYARGMNRIRRFFIEQTPAVVPYLIQSAHDDSTAVMANAGLKLTWYQMWLTTAGMVAMITAILVGAWASLAAGAVMWWGLPGRVAAGALAFLAALAGLARYQKRHWADYDQRQEIRFPSPNAG